eukprot:IDg863t1
MEERASLKPLFHGSRAWEPGKMCRTTISQNTESDSPAMCTVCQPDPLMTAALSQHACAALADSNLLLLPESIDSKRISCTGSRRAPRRSQHRARGGRAKSRKLDHSFKQHESASSSAGTLRQDVTINVLPAPVMVALNARGDALGGIYCFVVSGIVPMSGHSWRSNR